jgi:hypothetical protein
MKEDILKFPSSTNAENNFSALSSRSNLVDVISLLIDTCTTFTTKTVTPSGYLRPVSLALALTEVQEV